MKYTRLYCSDDGESHFEDVELDFKQVEFAPPAPPVFISAFEPAAKYGFIKGPVGWYGDWHPAPERQMMLYLAGEVEAEVSDGEIRRFGPGSVVLVEDTAGRGHRSLVIGDEEVFMAVVQLPD